MSRKRMMAAFGVVGALVIAAIAVPAISSFAEDVPVPGLSSSAPSEAPTPPDLGETNLDLFANLDDRGQCLLKSSVFPSGGVGFADSSLPYDNLEPLERAYSITRAEIIRSTMDEMSGVTEVRGDSGALTSLVVHVIQGTPAYADGIAGVVERGRKELKSAYDLLTSVGVEVELRETAVVSLTESCAIQDDVRKALQGPVQEAGFEYVTDATTGQLRVTVQPGMRELAAPRLSEFGQAVLLDEFLAEVGTQGLFSGAVSGQATLEITDVCGANCVL